MTKSNFKLVYIYNYDGNETMIWDFTPEEMQEAFDSRPKVGKYVCPNNFLKSSLEELAILAGRIALDIPQHAWDNPLFNVNMFHNVKCAYNNKDCKNCAAVLRKNLALFVALSYKEIKIQERDVRAFFGPLDAHVLMLFDEGDNFNRKKSLYYKP